MRAERSVLIIYLVALVIFTPRPVAYAGIVSGLANKIVKVCKSVLEDDSIFNNAEYLEITPNEILVPWESLHESHIKKLNNVDYQPEYVPKIRRVNEAAGYRDVAYFDDGTPVKPVIRVRMPTGHIFRRLLHHSPFKNMGVAWLDETSGLVWSAVHSQKTNAQRASEICKNLTGRQLPMLFEYRELAAHFSKTSQLQKSLLSLNTTQELWAFEEFLTTTIDRYERFTSFKFAGNAVLARPLSAVISSDSKINFRCVMRL